MYQQTNDDKNNGCKGASDVLQQHTYCLRLLSYFPLNSSLPKHPFANSNSINGIFLCSNVTVQVQSLRAAIQKVREIP